MNQIESMRSETGHGQASLSSFARQHVKPSSHRPRVFLYSHDTYGLGHLRRNLAIAEHLLSRRPAYSVRLITGSPLTGSWSFPPDLDVTALPPVVKIAAETYRPRHSQLPFGLVKAHREAQILKAVIAERPDMLLVDHAPAGMNAELLSTLAFIRREMPGTSVVLGLRDILDDPEVVRRIWEDQGIIPLLDSLYDRIFVYGCRSLFDVVEAYRIPPRVAAKLSYCGYVARPPKAVAKPASSRPSILVTAGGGEDGHFLMEAYIKALALLPAGAVRTTMITGPLMSQAQRESLESAARQHADFTLSASTSDLPTLLDSADLVIAMAGYNTSVEIVASGKPAILVPRAAPRAEQRMRAAMLSRLGYVWAVEQGAELDRRLADRICDVLEGKKPQPRNGELDLNGAFRVGEHCDQIVASPVREREVVI